MKAILFYLLAAVAVMFTFPATAAEEWHDRTLIAAHADVMPAIVAIDDSPMLAEQSARHQPEAVAITADKLDDWPEDEGVSWYSNALWPDGSGAMHEVGWRN
jgi:hypothetical protein